MRTVESVFISSIERDFGEVRMAVKRAVESLGMRPLMAETAGASVTSPQRALLDLVARSDIFLLILGPRYSQPTEDEFNEARRLARPILVLRQAIDAEPEQEAFVERVAGGWTGGRLWGPFDDAADVGFAAVQALTNLRNVSSAVDHAPVAQQRAHDLLHSPHRGDSRQGSIARVAHVPLSGEPLLDAVALDRAGLGDEAAGLARIHHLVAQTVGIDARVTAAGISLHEVGGYANNQPLVSVGSDGAVVVAFGVGGDDQFAGMRVDPGRLGAGIRNAGLFARAAWDMLDEREMVQQVAVAVAIPDAQYKVFGASTGGSSIQMGGFGLSDLVVPVPARVVRRAEVGSDELSTRLMAEVRRVFADAGAAQS